MVKSKKATAPPAERRISQRLMDKPKPAPIEKKKKPATKRAAKPKKAKQAENGSTKAEEPKAEATDAK